MNISANLNLQKPLAGNGLSDKGSLANRIEYMGESMKEFTKFRAKTGLTLVGGVATTAAATVATTKSKTIQDGIKKLGEDVMKNESVKKFVESAKPHVKKATSFVKNLPGPAKVVLAAGAGLTALVLGVQAGKAEHKLGQIDQKYTDKASVQKYILG